MSRLVLMVAVQARVAWVLVVAVQALVVWVLAAVLAQEQEWFARA
jgi:hypothetical protein